MTCKYFLAVALAQSFTLNTAAQAFSELDINAFSVRVHANGLIGQDLTNNTSAFTMPSLGGAALLHSSGLWIGGTSTSGQLHLAAHMYQSDGLRDFHPGPLRTDDATISPAVSAQYDRVWKIDRHLLDTHRAYFDCLADPGCDVSAQFGGYEVPEAFLSWPAMGDPDNGQAAYLAPFVDFDGNGLYEPNNGDHPCILGDQALYCIFNDNLGEHQTSGGLPIGLEAHMMVFGYSDPRLDGAVFVLYKLINRSTQTLEQCRIGQFADLDLGCSDDDVIGSDVGRSLIYVRNGDDTDQSCSGATGFGEFPPVFGMALLKGHLLDADATDNAAAAILPAYNGTGFQDGIVDNERFGLTNAMHFWRQGPDAITDPAMPSHHYNYMRSLWKDGSELQHGGNGYESGGVSTVYAFPGTSDPLGAATGGNPQPVWSAELPASGIPVDPRGLAGMGPFTLDPGEHVNLLFTYAYGRAGDIGPETSIQALLSEVDSLREFASSLPGLWDSPEEEWPACYTPTTRINEQDPASLRLELYPNPTSDAFMLKMPDASLIDGLDVVDATGRSLLTLDRWTTGDRIAVDHWSPGLYLVKARGRFGTATVRLVVE